jgi:hypothetical protein
MMAQRRSIQNAADAATLAASQDLPIDGTTCAGPDTDPTKCLYKVRHDAEVYSAINGGTDVLSACASSASTNCYQTPYKGSSGLLEIRLRNLVSGVFTNVVGLGKTFSTSARAVGSAGPRTQFVPGTTSTSTRMGTTIAGTTSTSTSTTTTPGNPTAIFAYTHNGTDACAGHGITINGNPQTSVDAVVSNGTVTMNATGTLGYAAYGPPALNCPLTRNAGTVTSSNRNTSVQGWPVTYNRASICAGHDSAAARTLDAPADGVYCSTNSAGITLTGLGGGNMYNLTVIAPKITIDNTENHFTLAPFTQGLTLWQNGANVDLAFDHNNSGVNGTIWVENGDLTYNGNSGTTGFYEAQNITLNGNSYVMHGSGPGACCITTTTTTTTTTPGLTDPGTTTTTTTPGATTTIGTSIGLKE